MIHRYILLIFIILILSTNTYAAPRDNLDKVRLQLKWYHQFQFAGYYAAIEKGIYQKAGLDVVLKEGKPGVSSVDEVLSGRADYGIGLSSLIVDRSQGKPVVLVASIFQHSPEILILKKGEKLTSLHELKGQRIMLRPSGNIAIRGMLINEGINLEDINIIPHTWNIDDLINNKVSAISAYSTDAPFILEQRGFPFTIVSPLTYGIDFYGDCLFTSGIEIKNNPNRVKAFREATLQGWKYAMKNPEELIDIIITKYGSKASRAYMLNEWKMMNKLILPKLVEMGHMNQGRWKHIGDTFVKLGMLKPDYSLKGFMYDPHPKADYKRVYRTMRIIVAILVIVGVLILILIFFNLRLKKAVKRQTRELSETNQKLVDDITRRKKAEEELKESEEKYRRLTDNLDEVIYSADPETYVCTFINQSVEKIFGYTASQWLEDPTLFNQILHPDDRDRVFSEMEKASKTFENIILTYRIIRKDKSIRWVDDHITWEIKNGKAVSQNGMLYDITDRKLLEEERQKMHKIESIGLLAGGIAHDFNNILAGILNNVHLSKMHIDCESKEYKNLESAEKAIYRATNLTRQLLTFSRGGAPILKTLSILKILKESAEFALKGSNVKCEYDAPHDLWPVEVDEGQMNQVLHNLIINAIQAMPEGGTIHIYINNIVVSPDTGLPLQEGRYVKVVVQDQGVGIDKAHLMKIFDPYYTTKEASRGLGLSITYSIIKQHDGHISAESEVGVGTTFTIYLPASEKQVEEHEKSEDAPVAGEGKILFMDDEEMIRESVGELLTINGYEVEFAKDGEEVIELYKKTMEASKPYDAVILDLTIRGGMGGKEAVKKLQEIDPDVRAIVSSGYSNDPVMANFREYGFIDVFNKASYSPNNLCRILNKVVKERQ